MKIETGQSFTPKVENPNGESWRQNFEAAQQTMKEAQFLFTELSRDVSESGRRNINKMLRTLVPLSLAASYLLSACSEQQTPTVTSTGEGDTGPTPTLVIPPTEVPTQLPPTETPTPNPDDLAIEVQKYLEGIDQKDFGPVIAKSLFDRGITLAKEAELLRKNGINIATSAMPDATFYIAPGQGLNGDVLSMGFRSDTNADWVTVYATEGPNGYWFQLIQNKLERDVNGNPTGSISIVILFQYGSRGDVFDNNYTSRP